MNSYQPQQQTVGSSVQGSVPVVVGGVTGSQVNSSGSVNPNIPTVVGVGGSSSSNTT